MWREETWGRCLGNDASPRFMVSSFSLWANSRPATPPSIRLRNFFAYLDRTSMCGGALLVDTNFVLSFCFFGSDVLFALPSIADSRPSSSACFVDVEEEDSPPPSCTLSKFAIFCTIEVSGWTADDADADTTPADAECV